MESYERRWGDGCVRRLNSTLIGLARLAILEAKTELYKDGVICEIKDKSE
jgi:hypothetical protein